MSVDKLVMLRLFTKNRSAVCFALTKGGIGLLSVALLALSLQVFANDPPKPTSTPITSLQQCKEVFAELAGKFSGDLFSKQRFPSLSKEEANALFQLYQSGDEKALDILLKSASKPLNATLYQYRRTMIALDLEAEDIRSELLMHTIEVLPKYDASLGNHLNTFLFKAFDSKMKSILARTKTQKRAQLIEVVDESTGATRIRRQREIRLDDTIGSDPNSDLTLVETLVDRSAISPEAMADYQQALHKRTVLIEEVERSTDAYIAAQDKARQPVLRQLVGAILRHRVIEGGILPAKGLQNKYGATAAEVDTVSRLVRRRLLMEARDPEAPLQFNRAYAYQQNIPLELRDTTTKLKLSELQHLADKLRPDQQTDLLKLKEAIDFTLYNTPAHRRRFVQAVIEENMATDRVAGNDLAKRFEYHESGMRVTQLRYELRKNIMQTYSDLTDEGMTWQELQLRNASRNLNLYVADEYLPLLEQAIKQSADEARTWQNARPEILQFVLDHQVYRSDWAVDRADDLFDLPENTFFRRYEVRLRDSITENFQRLMQEAHARKLAVLTEGKAGLRRPLTFYRKIWVPEVQEEMAQISRVFKNNMVSRTSEYEDLRRLETAINFILSNSTGVHAQSLRGFFIDLFSAGKESSLAEIAKGRMSTEKVKEILEQLKLVYARLIKNGGSSHELSLFLMAREAGIEKPNTGTFETAIQNIRERMAANGDKAKEQLKVLDEDLGILRFRRLRKGRRGFTAKDRSLYQRRNDVRRKLKTEYEKLTNKKLQKEQPINVSDGPERVTLRLRDFESASARRFFNPPVDAQNLERWSRVIEWMIRRNPSHDAEKMREFLIDMIIRQKLSPAQFAQNNGIQADAVYQMTFKSKTEAERLFANLTDDPTDMMQKVPVRDLYTGRTAEIEYGYLVSPQANGKAFVRMQNLQKQFATTNDFLAALQFALLRDSTYASDLKLRIVTDNLLSGKLSHEKIAETFPDVNASQVRHAAGKIMDTLEEIASQTRENIDSHWLAHGARAADDKIDELNVPNGFIRNPGTKRLAEFFVKNAVTEANRRQLLRYIIHDSNFGDLQLRKHVVEEVLLTGRNLPAAIDSLQLGSADARRALRTARDFLDGIYPKMEEVVRQLDGREVWNLTGSIWPSQNVDRVTAEIVPALKNPAGDVLLLKNPELGKVLKATSPENRTESLTGALHWEVFNTPNAHANMKRAVVERKLLADEHQAGAAIQREFGVSKTLVGKTVNRVIVNVESTLKKMAEQNASINDLLLQQVRGNLNLSPELKMITNGSSDLAHIDQVLKNVHQQLAREKNHRQDVLAFITINRIWRKTWSRKEIAERFDLSEAKVTEMEHDLISSAGQVLGRRQLAP